MQRNNMKEVELEKILERTDLARSGPWTSFIEGRDFTSGSSFIMVGDEENGERDIELIGATEYDQNFIANARQDIPKLIEEIVRLNKLLEK